MHVDAVRLTPENLPLCAPLWGGRESYGDNELQRVLDGAARLLFQGRARGAIVFEDSRPHPTSAALVAQPFRTAKFGGPGRPEGLRDVPYSRT